MKVDVIMGVAIDENQLTAKDLTQNIYALGKERNIGNVYYTDFIRIDTVEKLEFVKNYLCNKELGQRFELWLVHDVVPDHEYSESLEGKRTVEDLPNSPFYMFPLKTDPHSCKTLADLQNKYTKEYFS
jgi:hypothetical protein